MLGNSNHWVVSGKHTDTGHALHANDYHSGADLPTRMTIAELSWPGQSLHGGHFAGIPGQISGRSNYLSWSMVIAFGDSTDLWEEELNEDGTQYKVDGEWRNLTKTTFDLYPMGKEPVKYDLFSTHRGPLFTYEFLLKIVGPKSKSLRGKYYSLGWTLMHPGETSFEYLF